MKLVIFDAYGTLISTGTGSLDAVKKILALQEQEIDPKQFYGEWKKLHRIHMDQANVGVFLEEEKIFRLDLRQLYQRYGINRDSETDSEIMLETLGKRSCFEESIGVVESLKKRYRVVIGSTTDNEPLLLDMKRNGLKTDAVYTSETIRKYKPAPEFYSYILRQEKCLGDEAVFVGDSYVDDVAGPGKAGIRSILVDRKGNFRMKGSSHCEEKEPEPYIVTESLKNIEACIHSMFIRT